MMRKIMIIYILLGLVLIATTKADYYNVTDLNAANNIYEQARELNTLTENMVAYAILISVTVITFVIITANFNNAIAGLGAAGFIAGLTSTIMLPLELIPFYQYQIFVLLSGVAIIISLIVNK